MVLLSIIKIKYYTNSVPILFITGIDDYKSSGYDVQAIHYLLKPVDEYKLEECLNRILSSDTTQEPSVMLQIHNQMICVQQKDIISVEVFAHQCVYTTTTSSYTVFEA